MQVENCSRFLCKKRRQELCKSSIDRQTGIDGMDNVVGYKCSDLFVVDAGKCKSDSLQPVQFFDMFMIHEQLDFLNRFVQYVAACRPGKAES